MNILFIPHVPNLTVINRVYEFSKVTNSYFLYWEIDNSSFKQKILSQIKSLSKKREGKRVQIPLLFKPEGLSVKFNTFNLNRLIDELKIDKVVNANALLFDIEQIKVPVTYDLVDDHLEVNSDIGLNEKRVAKIKKDIKHSKGVVAVTSILEQKVKILNNNTITIENGLYLDRFKEAKSLKKELGLEGKKVFGFIGGIEEWTGLEEAIKNYLKIKDTHTAFLVVGGNNGSYYKNLVKNYSDEVLFVGSVHPKNVADYFKSIDIGLIPFKLNDFTNNAYPIKALEYGLAGANVLSTPLTVLKEKKLPFIKFCEIDEFYHSMSVISRRDSLFDFSNLSWKKQAEKLLNFVERLV